MRTIRFGNSIELCGGTHVPNTSDIWYFKITSESAIAAGIRRIEAITSDAVQDYFLEHEAQLKRIRGLFKGARNPVQAVTQLQEENQVLKKQVEQMQRQQAGSLKDELLAELQDHDSLLFLAKKVDLPAGAIKDLLFEMGRKHNNLAVLLATDHGGKAMLNCFISKEVTTVKDLHAGTIVRELGSFIKGGGGGQPFFATAGGKDPEGIPDALEAFRKMILN